MNSNVPNELLKLRVGTGVDVHAFGAGESLILAGVPIEHERGLIGHSDADLVAHAVTDAILGGAGLADIGTYFPSEDDSLLGADSMQLLEKTVQMLRDRATEIINVDCVVAMQAPKLGPYKAQMEANLAKVLGIDADRITVRATTTDHLGFVGRGEGAAAFASCLVYRSDNVNR